MGFQRKKRCGRRRLGAALLLEMAQQASLRVCALVDLIDSGSTSRMPASHDRLRGCRGAGKDVAQGAQGGRAQLCPCDRMEDGHERTGVACATHAVLHRRQIDAVVAAVGHVRQRPARVHQHLVVLNQSSLESVGVATVTEWRAGCGLPRIRLERAHTALRSGAIWPIEAVASIIASTRSSRAVGEDEVAQLRAVAGDVADGPDGLLAHVERCSAHRATSGGTPLALITTSHCFDVPDAMLVRHHAASNWSFDSGWPSIVTKAGTRLALMQSSMGGLRAIESCLRSARTATSESAYSSAGPLRATKPSAV